MAAAIVWKDAPFIIRDRDAVKLDEPLLCLGRGANGEVHAGTYEGNQIAKKSLYLSTMLIDGRPLRGAERDTVLNALYKECEILGQITSPFVVKFFGMTLNGHDEPDSLIMERLVPFTSVYPPGVAVDALSWRMIAFDVLRGLQALANASPPIIHRDLKPTNLLVAPDGRIKLADLGLARAGLSKALTLGVGSLAYMAPELRDETATASPAIDCFSFGVMMMELWLGESPNPSPEMRARRAVPELERRAAHLARIPAGEVSITNAIKACLSDEPVSRPTCTDLLARIANDTQLWSAFETISQSTPEDVAKRAVRLVVTSLGIVPRSPWRANAMKAVERMCRISETLLREAHACGIASVVLKAIQESVDPQDEPVYTSSCAAILALVGENHSGFGILFQTDDVLVALGVALRVHDTQSGCQAVLSVIPEICLVTSVCGTALPAEIVTIFGISDATESRMLKSRFIELKRRIMKDLCRDGIIFGDKAENGVRNLYKSVVVRTLFARAHRSLQAKSFHESISTIFMSCFFATNKENREDMLTDGVFDSLIALIDIMIDETKSMKDLDEKTGRMFVACVYTLTKLIETKLVPTEKMATLLSVTVKFMNELRHATLHAIHVAWLKLLRSARWIINTGDGSTQILENFIPNLNSKILKSIVGSLQTYPENDACCEAGIGCLECWPAKEFDVVSADDTRAALKVILSVDVGKIVAIEHQIALLQPGVTIEDMEDEFVRLFNDFEDCWSSLQFWGFGARLAVSLSKIGVDVTHAFSEPKLSYFMTTYPEESMLQEFGVQILDLLEKGYYKAALTALAKHADNANVLGAAFNVLWRAAHDGRRGDIAADSIRFLKLAVSNLQQVENVAKSVMRLISSLCMEDASVAVLLQDVDIFKGVCRMMQIHENADLQKDGCRAIYCLLKAPMEQQILEELTVIITDLAVEVLDSAVSKYPHVDDVQLYGRLALNRLG